MMSCHITILSNYNTNITYKFQTNGWNHEVHFKNMAWTMTLWNKGYLTWICFTTNVL
jgi:hypothetical protein